MIYLRGRSIRQTLSLLYTAVTVSWVEWIRCWRFFLPESGNCRCIYKAAIFLLPFLPDGLPFDLLFSSSLEFSVLSIALFKCIIESLRFSLKPLFVLILSTLAQTVVFVVRTTERSGGIHSMHLSCQIHCHVHYYIILFSVSIFRCMPTLYVCTVLLTIMQNSVNVYCKSML